ncbi:MAG: ABC transporter transmembrane domain-containing protein [Chloroflexota bacterium]|nr:ABC transporter transmembrane domain-containing protein [Chloroflexota bacterium]
MLFKFLYRNLKGYRFLVVLAILVTITQVGSDLLAVMPLKFIPSKINNPGTDPACTIPFLDGILSVFDTSKIDPSLQSVPPGGPDEPPPSSPCPASPSDQNAIAHPTFYHHSVGGVIVFSVLWLILFGTISAILVYFDLYLATAIAQNLTAKLRGQLFEHLQRLSLDWHGKQKKGDLVQRVTGNISDIEKLVTDGLVDLIGSIFIISGAVAIMYLVSPQYTLLSLVILPALFMIVIGYTRGIKAASKKAAKAGGQVADVATEDINALTVIRAFTLEEREDLRFQRYVGKHREASLRAGGLQAQFTPIVAVLVVLGTTAVIGIGGYVAAGNPFNGGIFLIEAGTIDVGTLLLFLTYLKMFYQPIRDLSKLTNLYTSASSGAERIQEVLDQAPEINDTEAPYYGPHKLRGEITFENVVFGYTPERPILKGINLHIPSGKKVALVGLSGGGKTTLVKLIPRFYELQQNSGSVKLDGVDNRMYPLNILRQNVSMVLQDSVLFEGTIRENILIGRAGATDEEIIEAAKKAQIHETIMSYTDGYETAVREQGKNFSGGQRQRLAIARAILRDAPILILDEPTASLDVEAEAEVMNALDKLVVGRSVLMISHRLSTLGSVDEIIVLKEGKIVEQGSYQQLKRNGGVFANLLAEQNRYNVERAGEKSILRSAFVPPAYYEQQVAASPLPQQHHQQRWVPPAPAQPVMPAAPIGGNGRDGRDGRYQGQQIQQPRVNPQRATPPRDARVLIELDGKIIGERVLNKDVLTVGRLAGNDVQVPNQRVSRLHAKIRSENGSWIIEDADSVNGIIYQGNRVERLALSNGDRIQIAPTAVLHYKAM